MSDRYPSAIKADLQRTFKVQRTPAWLRQFIGKQAIKIQLADAELKRQGEEPIVSPGLAEALKVLARYATEHD
jgi:hypothetical protein